MKPIHNILNLKKIELHVKPGELVCIVGTVGSGKSSLLSAILGDMIHIDNELVQEYSSRDDLH